MRGGGKKAWLAGACVCIMTRMGLLLVFHPLLTTTPGMHGSRQTDRQTDS